MVAECSVCRQKINWKINSRYQKY